MNHNPPDLSRSPRARCLQQMREQTGGGLALVPTAPEVRAQSRFALSRTGTTAISITCPDFPSPRRSSRSSPDARRRPARAVLPREERRSARSGTAFATAPTPRARSSASTRRTRSPSSTGCCPTSPSDRPALYTPLGLFARMGPEGHRPAERGARAACAPASRRPRKSSTCGSALDALRLVKDEHELALMRRAADDFRRRASARDGAHARRLVRIPGRGRARARVPAQRRAGGRVPVDRRRRPERLRAALSRQQPAAAGRRAAADRRRLRIPGLRVGHHAHVSRSNGQFTGPQKDDLRARARRAARVPRRGAPGRRFPRLPQGRRARAGAGLHRPRALQGHARRGARERQLQAVLHAPRRPLARHGRARRRPLPGEGRLAEARARHGADRRARHVHPARRQRARAISGTSACASRTTCSSPRPASRT